MHATKNTTRESLPDVAECHMACFPASLSTRLGKAYVQKSLEWFLDHPKRFLFHIHHNGKTVGYCGGFIPSYYGDGSSSGMLQHAFTQAVVGLLKKPWLFFHSEVREQYPFIWRNIKRRLTGSVHPAPEKGTVKPYKSMAGLVVIGVHPLMRGSKIAPTLLIEFETKARLMQQDEVKLSVKKNNIRAIKAYEKYGWRIVEEREKTFMMKKIIH